MIAEYTECPAPVLSAVREGCACASPDGALSIKITRRPVTSSNVASVGYDPESRVLEVEFYGAPNRLYRFSDVPPEVFDELTSADSIGSYFARCIKNAYPMRRVMTEAPDVATSSTPSTPSTGTGTPPPPAPPGRAPAAAAPLD